MIEMIRALGVDGRVDVERVILAAPRGFCAGVEMAIKALAWLVRTFDGPVYCYHEIVHNKLVVRRFEQLGVVFVDDISEVPPGHPIMLSAHGSAPEVVAAATERASYMVDAVCPLVTKVHHEVKVRAGKGLPHRLRRPRRPRGGGGHHGGGPRGHPSGGEHCRRRGAPDFEEPVALLAQTTLSHRDWEGVMHAARDRFPDMWTPGRSDLCFATTTGRLR